MHGLLVRRLLLWAGLLGLVVTLSGCFKVTEDLTVHGDGSGELHLRMSVNEKAIATVAGSFSGLGGSTGSTGSTTTTTQLFRLGRQSLPGDVEVVAERVGDELIADVSFPFADAADFERKMRSVGAALSADPGTSEEDAGSLVITRRGDLIDVRLDQGGGGGGFSTGGDTGFGEVAPLLNEDLRPSFVVRVHAPGRVVTSNADRVEGTTAVWDLVRPGAPTTLELTAEAEPAVPPWLWAAGAALALVLVAAAAALVLRRTRLHTTPLDDTTPAPAAEG